MNKGVLELKSARRYSTGALSNTRPASNVLSGKINAAKTGKYLLLNMIFLDPQMLL